MKFIKIIPFFSALLFLNVSAQAVAKKIESQYVLAAKRKSMFEIKKVQSFSKIKEQHTARALDKITDVERYLNNITTLECNFTQHSSDGERRGKLYIAKPYRIKWDYHTPKNALIVGSKAQFIYYNAELQEVSYIPSAKVPGFFLAHKEIKFGENIKVISQKEEGGNIFLDLQDAKMQESNIVARIGLTLNSIKLFSIRIINEDQGSEVEIILNDLQINQPIDEKVFIFKDPNFFKLKNS